MNCIKKISGGAILAVFALSATIVSCGSSDNPEPKTQALEVKRHTQSRPTSAAGDSTDWVYFSFATGAEVSGITEANRMTRTDWDIAFNRFYMRTNSGRSGSGNGGAVETNKTSFIDVNEAPADGYVTDVEITVSGYSNGAVHSVKSTGNVALSRAIRFAGPPPTYTLNDNVFVVRTADGKFAKVIFESFHNSEKKSGYITFRYAYQPDGSRNLKSK